MDWLRNLDVELFRFINGTLSNPFFDWLMPLVSQNPFSKPARWFAVAAIVIAGIMLCWKRRYRAMACMVVLGIAVGIADGVVCNTVKHLAGRPRPFSVLPDVRRPGSKAMEYPGISPVLPPDNSDSKTAQIKGVVPANPMPATRGTSMPSAHSANCFAAAMVLFVFYRRAVWIMLPVAFVVAFSRVYNGVHYPSDVIVGAILGAGTAAALLWLINPVLVAIGSRGFHVAPQASAARDDQSL